jgi:hypothetical protein
MKSEVVTKLLLHKKGNFVLMFFLVPTLDFFLPTFHILGLKQPVQNCFCSFSHLAQARFFLVDVGFFDYISYLQG